MLNRSNSLNPVWYVLKVECPVCSSSDADLDEYFGMVECKNCGMKVSYSEYLDKRSLNDIVGNR